jgi:hypothetical protein
MGEKLYVSIPTVMLYERDFSLMEIGVYYGVKSFRNAKTGECYPSIQTIADRIKVSVRTVKSVLKKFEFIGLIKIKRTDSSSHYSFPELDVKGSTLIPQDLYEKLDAKEVGFYTTLLSFRNNDKKLCNVPLALICERANLSKTSGTASAYIQSLQEKGVLVATRTNRAYSFAFPTLTFDSELEIEKSQEYEKANEVKSIKPSNNDYTPIPTKNQAEVKPKAKPKAKETEEKEILEKVATMKEVEIVENTIQEYDEDEEEEFSKNWAYRDRFNKAHGVVYKKKEPKKVVKQSKALDLLLNGLKSSKIAI